MAFFCSVWLLFFMASTCLSGPVKRDVSNVKLSVDEDPTETTSPNPEAPYVGVVVVNSDQTKKPAVETAAPTAVTAATPELRVQVADVQTESSYSFLPRSRCCRIGRKAARKGYSCYIDRAILERRLNMPHRYKMKFTVHGPKYGYKFAGKLEYCAKNVKRSSYFRVCCSKNASAMDSTKRLA